MIQTKVCNRMKRREFLKTTVGLTGSLLPAFADAAKPCPPSSFSVGGGTGVQSNCVAAGDLEADWLARSRGAGVVWAHDFRTDAEVNNFIKAPNDLVIGVHHPSLMAHRTTADGITGGGCLEVLNIGSTMAKPITASDTRIELTDARDFPAVASRAAAYEVTIQSAVPRMKEVVLVVGKQDNALLVERGRIFPEPAKFENQGKPAAWAAGAAVGMDSDGGWARPLSALVAGDNGLSSADPAAGGSLKRRVFRNGRSLAESIYNFRTGYYGHADYHRFYDTWNGESGVWDGDELFLQFRVKIDPRRLDPGNEGAGKLWFLHMMGKGGAQQLVMNSPDIERKRFSIFTNYGSNPNSRLTGQGEGVSDGSYQSYMPNSKWERSCVIGNTNGCWEWPVGEWVTLLLHVKPGHDNDFMYPLPSDVNKGVNLITVDTSAFQPSNDGTTLEFETNAVPVRDSFRFANALSNQAENYFQDWRLRFMTSDSVPTTLPFKVLSYRVVNGRARWRVAKQKALDTMPAGVPAGGNRIRVDWASADNATYADTKVEVWAKRAGDADYVTLFSQADLPWIFGDLASGVYDLHPPGFNCFQPTGYQNVQDGVSPPRQSYWYRFDQVILSRQFIPAPID
jgi:hypothetical protein